MQETKRTIEADLICLKARPLANDSEADRMETERLLRSAIGAARRRETIVWSSAPNWPVAAGRLCPVAEKAHFEKHESNQWVAGLTSNRGISPDPCRIRQAVRGTG